MKFILSFLTATTLLSAGSSSNLNLGNAALTPTVLCTPSNNLTPPAPVVFQCAPLPVTPPKSPVPVIPVPNTPGSKCPDPTPTSATPEPSSYALLGAGLMTAGLARKFRKK